MTVHPLFLFSVSLLVSPLAAAQVADTVAAPETTRQVRPLDARVRLSGVYFSNFAQAPPDQPQVDIVGAMTELLLTYPLTASGRAQAYGSVRLTVYDEFNPSTGTQGGLRWTEGVHHANANVAYLWRTPRFEFGDAGGFADVFRAQGLYAVRLPNRTELSAVADFYTESGGTMPERHGSAYDLGGALRYRGFGYRFSPEAGASLGQRIAGNDLESYGQRSLWTTLRMMPTDAIWLSVRYRNRRRAYSTDDLLAGNFERRDTRHHITLSTDVRLARSANWTTYYAYEVANSTRERRNFTAWLLTTGIGYRF
jgi:hypothetical protein